MRRRAASRTARAAIAGMKANLDQAVLGDLEQCMDDEVTRHLQCALTADHAEAAQAFVEKRPPVFTGR